MSPTCSVVRAYRLKIVGEPPVAHLTAVRQGRRPASKAAAGRRMRPRRQAGDDESAYSDREIRADSGNQAAPLALTRQSGLG
jgi:hypothetical protein